MSGGETADAEGRVVRVVADFPQLSSIPNDPDLTILPDDPRAPIGASFPLLPVLPSRPHRLYGLGNVAVFTTFVAGAAPRRQTRLSRGQPPSCSCRDVVTHSRGDSLPLFWGDLG